MPTTTRTLFAANLEQVPTDVPGNFARRADPRFSAEPALNKLEVARRVLTRVTAEFGAVSPDRLLAHKAVGMLPRTRHARFHTALQPIGSLIVVALVAILPRHPGVG